VAFLLFGESNEKSYPKPLCTFVSQYTLQEIGEVK
jgi:hypothetical protein